MPKTFLIHTDEANAEKVNAVAKHLLAADDLIADCEPSEAEKLGGDGFNPGHYEAIISAGLPNVQELVTEYKALGVMCHVVSIDDPEHVARLRAEREAADKAAAEKAQKETAQREAAVKRESAQRRAAEAATAATVQADASAARQNDEAKKPKA